VKALIIKKNLEGHCAEARFGRDFPGLSSPSLTMKAASATIANMSRPMNKETA